MRMLVSVVSSFYFYWMNATLYLLMSLLVFESGTTNIIKWIQAGSQLFRFTVRGVSPTRSSSTSSSSSSSSYNLGPMLALFLSLGLFMWTHVGLLCQWVLLFVVLFVLLAQYFHSFGLLLLVLLIFSIAFACLSSPAFLFHFPFQFPLKLTEFACWLNGWLLGCLAAKPATKHTERGQAKPGQSTKTHQLSLFLSHS